MKRRSCDGVKPLSSELRPHRAKHGGEAGAGRLLEAAPGLALPLSRGVSGTSCANGDTWFGASRMSHALTPG